MSTAETVKAQLQADIAAANEVTGKEDATMHDAVNSLIEGFGDGGALLELYDTPVDNIYTLSSEVAESTALTTQLEIYTLTPLAENDFSFEDNIGLTVATIEYLGEGEDVEGVCYFKRGMAVGFNVRVHGFPVSSPVGSQWAGLYNNHNSGDNITQVNYSDLGVFASCARSTNTWTLSHRYNKSFRALPGDYRFTIRRFKIPVSFFGGNAE